MAQKLEEQITTIERALGERMISHVLVILRAWLNELGDDNPYEQAYEDIRTQYDTVFNDWLTSDDPQLDQTLNTLTANTYRLADAAYASIRLKRGLSPQIYGFNPDNPQSVLQYFSVCLHLKESDLQWFRDCLEDPDNATVALMAVAALAKNIRECFNEQFFYALISGIHAANEIVAEQCLANVLVLLVHYDVRLDFFPDLLETFAEEIRQMNDEAAEAFDTLCALVQATKSNWQDTIQSGELTVDELPQELQNLLELTGDKGDMQGVLSWMPASEQEYMQGIVDILPDTWLFESLIGDSAERAERIAIVYLSVGRMDLLWEHIDTASRWLLAQLRSGKGTPLDYIHYGHCLLLQGDKMMAFEYYRQARQMCSPKEFFALFRPDRRALMEHGIPVEYIYMLEDQLINL